MVATCGMKRLANIIIFLVLICAAAYSQSTITGTFPPLANQRVKLVGFDGFKTYPVASTQISIEGTFKITNFVCLLIN